MSDLTITTGLVIKRRKFFFRCPNRSCQAIFSSEFEDEKDIEDIHDELLYLECECGGHATLLWD